MLKKTITYQDLDGKDRTEDFYFHITKADLAKWTLSNKGLEKKLVEIVQADDSASIIRTFEDILEKTYGVRSEDGKRFIQSDEIWTEFRQSGAYDVFFMELVTDAEAAANFIRNVLPKDLQAGIDVEWAKLDDNVLNLSLVDRSTQTLRPSVSIKPPSAWIRNNREPTDAEIDSMTSEQMADYINSVEAKVEEIPTPPAWIVEDRDPTKAELHTMSKAQMVDAIKMKRQRAQHHSE